MNVLRPRAMPINVRKVNVNAIAIMEEIVQAQETGDKSPSKFQTFVVSNGYRDQKNCGKKSTAGGHRATLLLSLVQVYPVTAISASSISI